MTTVHNLIHNRVTGEGKGEERSGSKIFKICLASFVDDPKAFSNLRIIFNKDRGLLAMNP